MAKSRRVGWPEVEPDAEASLLASAPDFTSADALAENLQPASETPKRSSPPVLTKYGLMTCFMLSLRSSPNQVLGLRLGLRPRLRFMSAPYHDSGRNLPF